MGRTKSVGHALKRKDFLSLLSTSKNKKRRDGLINIANSNELKAVIECIVNVLNGNADLPKSKIKKLEKQKTTLRKLTNRKASTNTQKKLLKQTGGFLSTIIPIALGLLSTIVGTQ